MKKQLIRRGVWETNSSSAHSVTLTGDKDFVLDTIPVDSEGNIHITYGEYGWDWFKTNSALEKARYAITAHNYAPESIIDVIENQTGGTVVLHETGDSWHPEGYVDHESHGILSIGSADMRDFIFSKNSWLFGGNDNRQAEPTFYDVPTFNNDGTVEEVVYSHKITVDGFNTSHLLKNYPTETELSDILDRILAGSSISKHGHFNLDLNYWSNDGRFEYSYNKKPDYETSEVYYLANDWGFSDWLREKYPNRDWEIIEKAREEYYNEHPEYVKKVKFHITEI